MDCSKLTAGIIAAECGKTATSGAEDDVLLINFDDIDRAESEVVDNVITKLILKSGAKAYPFTTFGKSLNDAGATFTKGTYRNTWVHNVPNRLFTKNELSKKFVNQIADGARVVEIVKNKEIGASGEVKYEAYGWDNGLELNEATTTIAMADGVVYDLNMGSSDTAQEGSLPKSVFDTDLATTELMIQGLTA